MQMKKYETLAQRTAIKEGKERDLMISLLGLSGELGEVVDLIYKAEMENNPDIEKIAEEIGDVLWYLVDISKKININLSDLMVNPIYSDMAGTLTISNFQAMLKEYVCDKAREMTNEDTCFRKIDFNKGDAIGNCLLLTRSSLMFVDKMKKILGHGHKASESQTKEIFLIFMCLVSLATAYQLDIGEIAEKNIEKLKKRYPNGFSEIDSIERIV